MMRERIPRISFAIADSVSKAFPERIENGGADVAIHYAESPECATEGDSIGGFHWRNKLREQQESLFGNFNPIFYNSGTPQTSNQAVTNRTCWQRAAEGSGRSQSNNEGCA